MKTTLLSQLVGAGVITLLLQQAGALALRLVNNRQNRATASKTEADATKVIASTLITELVEPLKRELERLRAQANALTVELENVRNESMEKDRLDLAHLVWCMKMRQGLTAPEVGPAPKLWPEIDQDAV